MEDDFHTIVCVVEQLDATELVKNRIFRVIDHVVGDNRRETMSFHGEDSAPKHDTITRSDKLLVIWHGIALLPMNSPFKQSSTNASFNVGNRVGQGFGDGLTLQ